MSKPLRNSLQLQTTLTAKKTIDPHNSTKLISAFDPGQSLIHQLEQNKVPAPNEYEDLYKINQHYISLFDQFLRNNSNSQSLSEQVNNSSQDNGQRARQRDDRYRNQCIRILKSNRQLTQRAQYLQKTRQDWKKVVKFKFDQGVTKCNPTSCEDLFERFLKAGETLGELEQQNRQIIQNKISCLSADENEQKRLTKLEKQFKHNQRKVNKEMEKLKYYQERRERYQTKMQGMQSKIEAAIRSINEIDLKLNQEQNRNARGTSNCGRTKNKSLGGALKRGNSKHP